MRALVSTNRWPSTSIETTTNCAFRCGPRNSGQLFCFFRWAIWSATPFRRSTFGAGRKTMWCPPQPVRHLGLANRPRRLQVCDCRLRCWDVHRPPASRKRNIALAEVVFHRLHSSITLEIWRRSARQIRTCWPVTNLPASLDMDIYPLAGASLWSWPPWMLSPVYLALLSLQRVVISVSRLPGLWLPLLSACLRWPPLEAHHSGAPGAGLWCSLAHCKCHPLCPLVSSMAHSAFLLWFSQCPCPHVSR